MKTKLIFLISILLLPNILLASECSSTGYTVLTINGMFTNEEGAQKNSYALDRKLDSTLNNEPVTVNYLHNPSHIAGLGDIAAVAYRKMFETEDIPDYDLTEIIKDASEKVKTEKVLLVAHSQGNFYANSFYNKVAGKDGGIPERSIGIYGVATPASYVSDGGKYITSSTDEVINKVRWDVLNILKANDTIALSPQDGNGHSFSDVYLKYRGSKITSEIKESLSRLKGEESVEPCISPPKLSLAHKLLGVTLAVADPLASTAKEGVTLAYQVGAKIRDNTSALALAVKNNLTANVYQVVEPSIETIANNDTENESLETTLVVEEKEQETKENKIEEPTPKTEATSLTSQPYILTNEIPSIVSENVQEIQKTSVKKVASGRRMADGKDEENEIISPLEETPIENNIEEIVEDTKIIETKEETSIPEPETIPETIIEDEPISINTTEPDITPPVINVLGDNPKIILKDSTYVEPGASASDNIEENVNVIISGEVDTSKVGNYIISYSASDMAGNSSTTQRIVKVVSKIYVPLYSFGSNNGDGNDWSVWSFNGSNVYDWNDSYSEEGYLKQNFKIQRYGAPSMYCSDCMRIGVFDTDPTKGFESGNLIFVNDIRNNLFFFPNGTYIIDLVWDALGYTYTITKDSVLLETVRRDVPNVSVNTWVGWTTNTNLFTKFPSNANFMGYHEFFPSGLSGGMNMMLEPKQVYNP